jgi:hypothetical protein
MAVAKICGLPTTIVVPVAIDAMPTDLVPMAYVLRRPATLIANSCVAAIITARRVVRVLGNQRAMVSASMRLDSGAMIRIRRSRGLFAVQLRQDAIWDLFVWWSTATVTLLLLLVYVLALKGAGHPGRRLLDRW